MTKEDTAQLDTKATALVGACEGNLRVRRGKSLLFSGKSCHLVLLGHCLYCYPLGSSKPPFSELDLSTDAHLSIHNTTTFTIKDQTWTTYMFQAEASEDRNTWLSALRHVEGLGRSLRDFFHVGRLLGHGMAGKVHECVDLLSSGAHYAVKQGLAHSPTDFSGAHGLLHELMILRRISANPHRTLPYLHDAFRTRDGVVQIVIELMTGNNICAQLAQDHTFTEEQARRVFREITEGVAHLHDMGISHRDLKPENIFYKDGSADAQIMILDFNLAKESHRPDWGASTPCGTSPYMAPEVLQHRMYNQAVDMWSLGCILHILLCGKVPFASSNSTIQDRKILEGAWDTDSKEWDCVSDAAKDLLHHLLVLQPAQRLDAQQCLAHPWLAGPRPQLPQAPSLGSPAVLRRMRSATPEGGSPRLPARWLRGVLPTSAASPGRSGVHQDHSFASLNEALDVELAELRKPPQGLPCSQDGVALPDSSPAAAPHHHQFGSPGRRSMIDEVKHQLELAGGAGLQDKAFGATH